MTQPRQRGERTDHSIKRLPDGKGWRARPTLGIDPVTGRQMRPTRVFPTKKAAQDWVTKQRRLWASASWSSKSPRTFDEVADHWLTLREADNSIGPNTVRADRESLAYARRAFGSVPVQKLTPAAIADWAATMTGKEGRALAPATKRRAIIRVKSVMGHALNMRWVNYAASAVVAAPEQKGVTATDATDIWTPKQMNAFLDHIAAQRLSGCFALTLLGLRREGGRRAALVRRGSGYRGAAYPAGAGRYQWQGHNRGDQDRAQRQGPAASTARARDAQDHAGGASARAPGGGPSDGRHRSAAVPG